MLKVTWENRNIRTISRVSLLVLRERIFKTGRIVMLIYEAGSTSSTKSPRLDFFSSAYASICNRAEELSRGVEDADLTRIIRAFMRTRSSMWNTWRWFMDERPCRMNKSQVPGNAASAIRKSIYNL